MGGLCTSTNHAPNEHEAPDLTPLTLEDFAQDQQQYVGQLAKLSSKTTNFVNSGHQTHRAMTRQREDMKVDPIIAQEFVETAKAIQGRQGSLMKQIIGLGILFDMSIASLSKIISQLN